MFYPHPRTVHENAMRWLDADGLEKLWMMERKLRMMERKFDKFVDLSHLFAR